jgi:hypothetical protein
MERPYVFALGGNGFTWFLVLGSWFLVLDVVIVDNMRRYELQSVEQN